MLPFTMNVVQIHARICTYTTYAKICIGKRIGNA